MVAKVAKKSNRGSKPGERRGGRKKGVPNKKNAATVKAIEASGLTPLDYMLGVLRDGTADTEQRFEAAKAAAPYVHPRLATIEHQGDPNKPLRMDMHWTVSLVRPEKRSA